MEPSWQPIQRQRRHIQTDWRKKYLEERKISQEHLAELRHGQAKVGFIFYVGDLFAIFVTIVCHEF